VIVPADPCEPVTPAMWQALRVAYPSTHRIDVALMLALDVETFAALYLGEPVDPSRVDPVELERAKARQLVQLHPAIDLLLEGAPL